MSSSSHDTYSPVLVSRYCRNSPLLKIFSSRHKTELWRQLWIWLAEAELELGLPQVTQEAIDELQANKTNIDWQAIAENEKRLKHDVMAHNHAYGKICPKAAGIIHLGATSCYVQDNSDLIVQREALNFTLKRLAICLKRLAEFADRHKNDVTVGRTHYQPASLVTVGKRAVLWAQELLMVLGSAVNKICMDIRLLQMNEELFEPFEKDQIGSSAMPFKRNPMKTERINSLARKLMNAVNEGLQTLATQGFERTLDDSAIRRINIPDSFFTTEAILLTLQNVFEGMQLNEATSMRNVQKELPFLALEKTLMFLTEQGVSRQEAHEKIREVSLKGQEQKCSGEEISFAKMLEDPFFNKVREESLRYIADPLNFTGRCRTQVDRFLKEELHPKIDSYLKESEMVNTKVQLDV
uniref:Adenylosuccinate lyase C-terminal domain-containing protein n=1 Tax=Acrobeloides nanus TaxID=290746 RepID=A0A914DLU9_9BILA